MVVEPSAAERHVIHEVRTCLNQIQGFGDLLAESAEEKHQEQLAARAAAMLKLARAARESIKAMVPQVQDGGLPANVFDGTELYGVAQQIVSCTLQLPTDATAEDEHDFRQIRAAAERLQQLTSDNSPFLQTGQPLQHETDKVDEPISTKEPS